MPSPLGTQFLPSISLALKEGVGQRKQAVLIGAVPRYVGGGRGASFLAVAFV